MKQIGRVEVPAGSLRRRPPPRGVARARRRIRRRRVRMRRRWDCAVTTFLFVRHSDDDAVDRAIPGLSLDGIELAADGRRGARARSTPRTCSRVRCAVRCRPPRRSRSCSGLESSASTNGCASARTGATSRARRGTSSCSGGNASTPRSPARRLAAFVDDIARPVSARDDHRGHPRRDRRRLPRRPPGLAALRHHRVRSVITPAAAANARASASRSTSVPREKVMSGGSGSDREPTRQRVDPCASSAAGTSVLWTRMRPA